MVWVLLMLRYLTQIRQWLRKRKPKATVSVKGTRIMLIVNGEYWDA